MEIVDIIVVGSGCSGAIAAKSLAQKGRSVLVLDAGILPSSTTDQPQDFLTKRREDDDQINYFLGKNFDVLTSQKHPNIAQQTAQRIFMTQQVEEFLPSSSELFFPVESLAKGGLGNGWGLGCCVFSDAEMRKCGLHADSLFKSYQKVSEWIGVSGHNDNASPYTHAYKLKLQPSINANSVSQRILDKYNRRINFFNAKYITLGRPSLALLTAPLGNRKAYEYKDIDFYENHNQSAFRPQYLIDELVRKSLIRYESNWLAIQFRELDSYCELVCVHLVSKENKVFKCKKLVLCAGALSTARIVLRSVNKELKLPLLCNSYSYVPMVHWPSLGKRNDDVQSGFAQLSMFYDPKKEHEDVTMASIYNYRSLLNFRILRELPFNALDGRKMLRLLVPSLTIAGIFHPAVYQSSNYLCLQKSDSLTGDRLFIQYDNTVEERHKMANQEYAIKKACMKLDCIPLKTVRTAHGGSIHYAGTLPISNMPKPLHMNQNGRLYDFNKVYIGDGSGLNYLPGKGLTLTLMAFAYHVAEKIIEQWEN